MRQKCKNTITSIIKKIKSLEQNKKCEEAMLIVDEFTSPLLSSVVYYFFSLGVKNITKISLIKKPQPHCIGIYYLSPKSLLLIKGDFKKQPTYHSINILLNEQASPQILKSLASESKVMERLAFFGQLKLCTNYLDNNLGIICEKEQIFKILMRNEQKNFTTNYGNKLFQSIISGYGKNFVLKVYYQQNQHITQILKVLEERYKEHVSDHSTNGANLIEEEEDGQKIVQLLLVDRKIDVVSPIVRNFFYFTMISQIFNVDYKNRKIKARQEDKTFQLSYDDAIFNEYKNLHISKAQTSIEPNFKKFKTENKAAQLKKQNTMQGVEIKHIIRDIPEFNRKVTSYQSQISLMYQISSLSKQENMPQIGEIQHIIVSGMTVKEQLSNKKIYQQAMERCKKIMNPNSLVKVWLLLILCNQLPQSDRKSLIQRIKSIPQFQNLGLALESNLSLISPKPIRLKPLFKKEKSFLDLHQSLLTTIISQITENGTSKTVAFKVIGEQIKKKESKFQKITKKQQKQWLVCMLGGLSINQICQLQRLEGTYQNIKINMLTDKIFTVWSYITQLGSIFI